MRFERHSIMSVNIFVSSYGNVSNRTCLPEISFESTYRGSGPAVYEIVGENFPTYLSYRLLHSNLSSCYYIFREK